MEFISYYLFSIVGISYLSILLDAFHEKKMFYGFKYLLSFTILGLITIQLLKTFLIYFVITVPIIIFLIVLFSYLKNKE